MWVLSFQELIIMWHPAKAETIDAALESLTKGLATKQKGRKNEETTIGVLYEQMLCLSKE